MKSNELKNVVARELNLKPSQVAVRTIPSVKPNKWVEVRVRPENYPVYPAQFSELHRRIALAIVYGPEFALRQSAGGNIGLYSISLVESQWVLFCEALTAVRTCCNCDNCSDSFRVALSYLNTRKQVSEMRA